MLAFIAGVVVLWLAWRWLSRPCPALASLCPALASPPVTIVLRVRIEHAPKPEAPPSPSP